MDGLSRAVKHKLQQHLRMREIQNFNLDPEEFVLSHEEVEVLVREVWGGKCAVTGRKMGSGE